MAEVVVQIRGNDALVTGLSDLIKDQLGRKLRYRPTGYQFEPAFKHRRWDGWVRLFEKDGRFPAGLAPRVMSELRRWNVPFRLDDERIFEDVGRAVPLHINPEVEDRWYQRQAVEASYGYGSGVVRAPTGSGKSVCISQLIQKVGQRAVVLVPTIDLLYQTRDFLEWALQTKVGMLGAGYLEPRDVTIATVRTMAKVLEIPYVRYVDAELMDLDDTDVGTVPARELASWVRSLGLLIVDECHMVAADTAYNIATSLNVPRKIGFSASPWRDDNADLKIEGALGPMIYRVDAKTLVDEGFLVPPIFRIVDTRPPKMPSLSWLDHGSWSKAYERVIVKNDYRNDLVSGEARQLIEQERTVLLLVKQLKHGERLRRQIPKSVMLAGSSPKDVRAFFEGEDRKRILDDLRAGRVRCVIATSVLDMGVDVPALDALVLAGGGKSSTRHLQRIGRVCRPAPGKDHGLVVDFDDSWGHVKTDRDGNGKPGWFAEHTKVRRKVERAEWAGSAIWL